MASSKSAPSDIMGMLNYYLVKKAPFQLPANVKEAIVKFAPIVDVVLLLLFAPIILLALGIATVALPFAALAGEHAGTGLGLALIMLIIQVGLMVAALPGLFGRRRTGWNLAFYGVILNLVYNLVTFNILGGIITVVLATYVLFQIRSYYK